MPLIDMPLSQLREYTGRNPKPADFDAYWDAALAEMRALDPGVELVPHAINAPFAECFHLYFTGVGGARVHAKYLRPKERARPHPAVLLFHGYSGNSGDWCDKLNYVAQASRSPRSTAAGRAGFPRIVGGVKGNTLRGHIIRGLDDRPKSCYSARSISIRRSSPGW